MKNYRFGFTLPELLVTIGIVAVLAAVVLPGIQKQTAQANQAKADKIAGQIQNGFMDLLKDANNNQFDITSGKKERITDLKRTDLRTDFSSDQANLTTSNKYFDSYEITDQNQNETFGRILSKKFAKRKTIRGKLQLENEGNHLMYFLPTLGLEEFSGARDDLNPSDDLKAYFAALAGAVPQINNMSIIDADGLDNVGDFLPTSVKNDKAIVIFERMMSVNNIILDDDTITLFRIIIDVNGEDGPNQLHSENNPRGDIFIYGLANNGNIYPADSEAFNNNVWTAVAE